MTRSNNFQYSILDFNQIEGMIHSLMDDKSGYGVPNEFYTLSNIDCK